MFNKFTFFFALFLYLSTTVDAQPADQISSINFQTEDGITIYGDVHLGPQGKAGPLILAFHQGASNARAEYAALIPRLLAQGYSVLAIDQRSGGDRLGGTNRTVDALQEGQANSMCDAYLDLEAALEYVKAEGFTGKRVAWGSSYSGALVMQLGYDYTEDFAGILGFSPASGGPMEDCSIDALIPDYPLPLLALRPAGELEYEHVLAQFNLFKTHGHNTFVSDPGTHGSSMLNPDRVPGSVEETWEAVLDFLARVFVHP